MIVTNDYATVVQWHPELILVSHIPIIWQGFLLVPYSNTGRDIRVKLKLVISNFSLQDAEIEFGKQITFIHSKEFSQRVRSLMQHATKVSTFLRELQSLISTSINTTHIMECNKYEATDNEVKNMLEQLYKALGTSEVQISSDNSLDIFKLSWGKLAIVLKKTKYGAHPWSVVYSDLPELGGPFEKNVTGLHVAKNKFKAQVELLKDAWSVLKEIDENCSVMDPLQPKPSHLYRQIYLSPSLSVFVKINPLNPMDLPEIKFIGNEIQAKSAREFSSKRLHNWDSRSSIIDNLMMLLNLDEFPKYKVKQEPLKEESTIVTDEECCICFSLAIDNYNLPDKICSNEKCRKHFHTCCLLQVHANSGYKQLLVIKLCLITFMVCVLTVMRAYHAALNNTILTLKVV